MYGKEVRSLTQTLSIESLDMGFVFSQAEAVYSAFVGLLAAVVGIGLGAYVWRRLKGAAMGI